MYTHSKWANEQTLKTDLRIIHNCPCLNIYVTERSEQDPSMPKFLISSLLGKMFAVGTCVVLCIYYLTITKPASSVIPTRKVTKSYDLNHWPASKIIFVAILSP